MTIMNITKMIIITMAITAILKVRTTVIMAVRQ